MEHGPTRYEKRVQEEWLGVVAETDDEYDKVKDVVEENGGRIASERAYGNYAKGCYSWVLDLIFPDKDSAMVAKLAIE